MINYIKITVATSAAHVLVEWPGANILGGIYLLHTCHGSVEDHGYGTPATLLVVVGKGHKHVPNSSTRFSQKTGAKEEYSDPLSGSQRSVCRKDRGTGRWPRLLPQGVLRGASFP